MAPVRLLGWAGVFYITEEKCGAFSVYLPAFLYGISELIFVVKDEIAKTAAELTVKSAGNLREASKKIGAAIQTCYADFNLSSKNVSR